MTPVDSAQILPPSSHGKLEENSYDNPVIVDVENDDFPDEKPSSTPQQKSAREMVHLARKTFKTGRTRDLAFRKAQLKNLLKLLKECREEIILALHEDLRKHRQEAIISEIDPLENDLLHTIYDLKCWAKPESPEKRLVNLLDSVKIYHDPYGVVLIMGAWNYPMLLALGPVIGAIAGGNCVILKPSELSPSTSQLLAKFLPRYLDKKAYQVYQGGIEETTDLLKEKFDYIFFTGSTQVGRIVHQAAAKNLTPTTLELGGKSPVYIDESADIERTTRRILWGRSLNSGQTCIAPDYILCTQEIRDKFIEKAREILKEFYGDDANPPQDISKIVTERHYNRLVNFLDNNKIAVGGKCYPKERLITLAILQDVSPDDPVMKEEIFGPLLPVIVIKNVQEAVKFINDRDKPLALYVFTRNKKIRDYILENTSSGAVTVNDTIMHILTENLPFGGVGSSGMGSYHGEFGFKTFTHQKAVLERGMGPISEVVMKARYPPYSEFKTNFTSTALKKRPSIPMECVKDLGFFLLGIIFAYLFVRLF